MSGAVNVVFRVANVLTLGLSGKLFDALTPSPKDQVQTLGDISRQTAKEGDPRVIVWGRVRPVGGNIIHCQKPIKRMVVTSTSSGGKGGSKKKQEQRTEHVYRTYAIGVCEGPITGFSRIWRNNKLVYDGRGTSWGAKNNPVFLKTFRLYLGGWDQMPDPTLQSIWGTGNVPAYRGTAYMVSINEDLTDQGGMVPQWQFEVERAEFIPSTSKLYGLLEGDAVRVDGPQPLTMTVKDMVHRYSLGDTLRSEIGLDDMTVRDPVQLADDFELLGSRLSAEGMIVEDVLVNPDIDDKLYTVTSANNMTVRDTVIYVGTSDYTLGSNLRANNMTVVTV
jgi:hypothetical protein